MNSAGQVVNWSCVRSAGVLAVARLPVGLHILPQLPQRRLQLWKREAQCTPRQLSYGAAAVLAAGAAAREALLVEIDGLQQAQGSGGHLVFIRREVVCIVIHRCLEGAGAGRGLKREKKLHRQGGRR